MLFELTVLVEQAAVVVESMGELVAKNSADCAVQEGPGRYGGDSMSLWGNVGDRSVEHDISMYGWVQYGSDV